MPRLSLYRPEKGNDFKFLDRTINEQFQVGGTDVFVHKYLGPVNPDAGNSTPGVPVNTIQDNEHKIAVVDFQQQTFSLHEEDSYSNESNKVRGMKNDAIFTQDLANFCEKYSDSLVKA